jgi:hypothetical protein
LLRTTLAIKEIIWNQFWSSWEFWKLCSSFTIILMFLVSLSFCRIFQSKLYHYYSTTTKYTVNNTIPRKFSCVQFCILRSPLFVLWLVLVLFIFMFHITFAKAHSSEEGELTNYNFLSLEFSNVSLFTYTLIQLIPNEFNRI